MVRTLEFRPDNRRRAAALCAIVAAVVLGIGWWPFTLHPRNEVSWIDGQNGLDFGGLGLAYEAATRRPTMGARDSGFTVELFLQGGKSIAHDGITSIVTVEDAREGTFFTIGQWRAQLLIRLSTPRTAGIREISLEVLRESQPRVVILSGTASGTAVYVDGQLWKHRADFVLDRQALDGPLVLGDAPSGRHSWNGRLFGLALLRRSIEPDEVSAHHAAWTMGRLSALELDPRLAALYAFDEGSGRVAKDRSTAHRDLTIPRGYSVRRKTLLAFPEVRWPLSRPELNDVVVNLFGFVPMGVLFYRYHRRVVGAKMLPAIILTTLTGALLSLIIETGQAWLPARNSAMADIALNAAGMLVGASLAASMASNGGRRY
jgi:hypothetical protein